MFIKIFNIKASVYPLPTERKLACEECAVVLDELADIECERVFIVGSKGAAGYEQLPLSPDVAGKFKYRVLSVMSVLTKQVVRYSETFDYSRYKNINN